MRAAETGCRKDNRTPAPRPGSFSREQAPAPDGPRGSQSRDCLTGGGPFKVFGMSSTPEVPAYQSSQMLYFAYGMNMRREAFGRRCPGADWLGVARLDGHRFVIAWHGYASVQPHASSTVWGVVTSGPELITGNPGLHAMPITMHAARAAAAMPRMAPVWSARLQRRRVGSSKIMLQLPPVQFGHSGRSATASSNFRLRTIG